MLQKLKVFCPVISFKTIKAVRERDHEPVLESS